MHDINPAPWLYEISSERFYYASDKQLRDVGYPAVLIDTLGGKGVDDTVTSWEHPLDSECSSMYLANDKLIGYSQRMTTPPQFELVSYRSDGSGQDWFLSIEDATESSIVVQRNVAVVGYKQADGYRLAAYNVESHAKAWGMKLPIRGLIADGFSTGPLANLRLSTANGVVAYCKFNVISIVTIGNGGRLGQGEFAAVNYIWDFELAPDIETCYLLIAGNQADTYVLKSLPFHGRSTRELYRFKCPTDSGPVQLLASGGYLLLSYPDTDNSDVATKLVFFTNNDVVPVLEHVFKGILQDAAAVGETPGSFLLAFSEREDEHGLPVGRSTIQRINLGEGAAKAIMPGQRLRQPVLSLTPFKQDCLVLLRGGSIHSYNTDVDTTKRLRKTRYPLLHALSSQDGSTLAVMSYTEAYLDNHAGQPMQVIVYK